MSDNFKANLLSKMSHLQSEAELESAGEPVPTPEEQQEARFQTLDAVNQMLGEEIENPPQYTEEQKKRSEKSWQSFTQALNG